MLKVESLHADSGGSRILRGVSLEVGPGEVACLMGRNGVGKTTTLKSITGRTRLDSGKIVFGTGVGEEITSKKEYEIYRMGIGRKFQTPSVFTEHTVFDNILLGLKGERGVFRTLFAKLSSTDSDRIEQVLKIVGLFDKKDDQAGSLAHGQKQWLEIGMLLAQDAKLLLVDEPAAGMTDEETHKTGELLLSLAGKHSIIVIEHDMVFVRQIASKVTVLHQGHVLCEGTVDDVQNNPEVRSVYLGRGKH